MNQTINQMTSRYSVRKYEAGKAIPAEHMEQILRAAQQSPTYINGQQYSIIVITDQDKKERMLEHTMPSSGKAQQYIADCGAFLLFVADFNKPKLAIEKAGGTLEISNHMEGLLIGAVDIGIGAEAVTVAAESLGYGTVMIGAVRRSAEALIKEYNLPSHTFPMLGVCVGHKVEDAQKKPRPRLPLHTFAHDNSYNLKDFDKVLDQFNHDLNEYNTDQGIPNYLWTDFVKSYYAKAYWTELSEVYRKQNLDIR